MRLSGVTRKKLTFRLAVLARLVAIPIGVLAAPDGASAAPAAKAVVNHAPITSTPLFSGSPTFVGPAATDGVLSGPTLVPATSSFRLGTAQARAAATAALSYQKAAAAAARRIPAPQARRLAEIASLKSAAGAKAPVSMVPTTTTDRISLSSAAKGVKGLKAVDSGKMATNVLGLDIEPPDQGLCAGDGYVVEVNNIGEALFFNTHLNRVSKVIPLDTMFGLTKKNWSSGGDISCVYDYANGGHFLFTEFVSASSEKVGGPFAGCFVGKKNTCFEDIAVTKGASPFGPYNVYTLNPNYNPAEPANGFLLNDFTKIGLSQDAFLLFYDEFPLVGTGFGGGFFNGAQQFAIDKNALERGLPVKSKGVPNTHFNVAIDNMGLDPTPDGTCASDNVTHHGGITCWYSDIPANAPDKSQFDNSHGGSAFMLGNLDFYGNGDSRIAVFDWTGLWALNSSSPAELAKVKFGGQLFSGVDAYYDPSNNSLPSGILAAQKKGPIPLGDVCGAAGLSVPPGAGKKPPASCPEGGIATNGDNFTQASQAQGKLWGTLSTEVKQSFGKSTETHMGAVYYVVDYRSFDLTGNFTLAGQGFVAPAHEDLSMPDLVAGDHGPGVYFFTLTGNGGPTHANHGGFYPSTAYAMVVPGSPVVAGATVHVADLGKSPADGFTEYQGYPGVVRPRWGDYSQGVYDPVTGKLYFSTEYIQYPNCTGSAFNFKKLGTCGGTRDGIANWGTSVNSITP